MTDRFKIVSRGKDSSGRPLRATNFTWQRYDRVNTVLKGRLVVIQGGFNKGVTASAGTHDLAGAMDYRTWNLSDEELFLGIKTSRDLGGAAYFRTKAEGFDPHWHEVSIGDEPMHAATAKQVKDYLAGLNALASRKKDTFSYRPKKIQPYQYEEDDMFTEADRKMLQEVRQGLETFRKNEVARDQAEADRDRERHTQIVTAMGQQADLLTRLINDAKDDATKSELTKAKNTILLALKNNPSVTGKDNPSDAAVKKL